MTPQAPAPISLNDLFPVWFDLVFYLPVLVVLFISVYYARRSYTGSGFMKRHVDFLNDQKDFSIKTLEQNRTFEEMIAKQYSEANERADRALAQSEEAIRLHAAALEQLARMNDTLTRVAGKLAGPAGGSQSGAPAS